MSPIVKPSKRPVTIGIGFPFRISSNAAATNEPEFDAIMLASDSQLTAGTARRSDAQKIIPIHFAGSSVLLAYAGSDSFAQRFIELFSERAAGVKIENARTPANLAEDIIRENRIVLMRGYEGQPDQRIADYHTIFLIAHFHNDTPHIYSLDLHGMIAARTPRGFITIGCASSLAEFILTGVEFSKITVSQATGLAVATIELCKIHDSACGGAVRMGIIFRDYSPKYEILPSVYLENMDGVVQSNSIDVHKSYVNRLVQEFWPFTRK